MPPNTNFREDLAISLGHEPEHYDFRRLEILIRRLRNKAKEAWGDILPLETAHRQGYAFTANIRIGMARHNALDAEPHGAAPSGHAVPRPHAHTQAHADMGTPMTAAEGYCPHHHPSTPTVPKPVDKP